MKPLRLSRAPDRDRSLVQPRPEGTKRLCTTLLQWTSALAALPSMERVALTAHCCFSPSLCQLGNRAAGSKGKALNELWCLRGAAQSCLTPGDCQADLPAQAQSCVRLRKGGLTVM